MRVNTNLARYRIVSKIGAGGMGEVYLAEDTRLRRSVALKVLPESLARDQDRLQRFEHEALSASALNHPNILTIYEFGAVSTEAGETHFLASEFIDGETLRARLERAPVTLNEALDITVQTVQALAVAQAANIIHRDIKPENVMLRRDGLVKVLDFGLAKLVTPDAETRLGLTDAGTVMGTAAYMSPEQASGKAVDARTDLFSVGVMLYEMVTGRRPFTGATPSHVIVAILEQEPPRLPVEVPTELASILKQMLAKKVDDRYSTAHDLLADLKQLQTRLLVEAEVGRASSSKNQSGREEAPPTSTEAHKSIAVLPFANLSADKENEYFCDGLAEELLNALAKIDDLKVAARTSAFSFKGKSANVAEIAGALNVNTVLEGSVRKAGSRIRITAQLINAADGYHLWSERYDREMKDIFDVQDEITVAVVDALKVRLFGEEQAAILKRQTRNSEAYELYLRGLSYFHRWTPDGFQKAIDSFKRALAIDPRYASAYAGLANAYTELSFFSFSAARDGMARAREAAKKALELDDTLGEAHTSLAIIKMYDDWDFAGAEQEFKRAIALDPGSAHVHNWYGWYLGLMMRFDDGSKELQRAHELDPLSDTINSAIGMIFYWSRQPERAVEQFRAVLDVNPNYFLDYSWLAEAHVQKGDFASAVGTMERVQQAANDPLTLGTAGYVYAKSGDHRKALDILNELEKRQESVPALVFAQIYAGLGDGEQVLRWLDKACDERSAWMAFLKVDPKFDPLRSDLRFQDLLQRVGFAP